MNVMEDLHKKVLRKFHTLCSVLSMTEDEKRTLVASFGVESSADIDTHDLIDICASLAEQADAKAKICNTWRRRVMAAIGSYLQITGQESNATIIMAIACRATGYSDFNKIPLERLRNIYNAFVNKTKDIQNIAAMINSNIAIQAQA